MNVRTKYSLTILALTMSLVVFLTGIAVVRSRSSIKILTSTSLKAIEKALFDELQEKERLSVKVLAEALTNPVYQYDMQRIYGLISAVKKQPDVLHVYVYDAKGRILHDGTADLLLYNRMLDDEGSKKALATKQPMSRTEGDLLYVSTPITLQNELLGGVQVAFSLKGIKADIARHRDELGNQYASFERRELLVIVIIAALFSLLGVASAFFLARSWSQPISLLSSLTTRIGKGEYDVDIPVHRSDEIGQLATSFKDMVKSLKDVRQKEERQSRRIEALHEINLATTSTLDPQAVLDLLLAKTALLLPYSAATVTLLNRETGELESIAGRNFNEKEWGSSWRNVGPSLARAVVENKAPLAVGNIQTDPRTKDHDFFLQHGLVSYVGVPLIVKDQILGVLSFYAKEEYQFSNEEVEFLTALAGQAAIAIQNSQLYEQAKRQTEDLERANKGKDEFLSVMSHELRTPLNVVIGYTGMVKDRILGEINPEQERALDKVVNRSDDLLRMITEILQATSIEAQAVKVARQEISLDSFLDDLRSNYEVPLDKGLTFNWDYPPELPTVKTDSEKLKHILQNLINNAVKFTDQGNVTISARYNPKVKAVEFKVADTGIGMQKEMLPSIFDMFRQVDSSETRAHGGVGIGLYLVKKLTELLGGKIEAESELGKGSIFTVTIPC